MKNTCNLVMALTNVSKSRPMFTIGVEYIKRRRSLCGAKKEIDCSMSTIAP